MLASLFTCEGPVFALQRQSAYAAEPCALCGRVRRTQVRDLAVELMSLQRQVWPVDGLQIAVTRAFYDRQLGGCLGVTGRPVEVGVREGYGRRGPLPTLLQPQANAELRAAPDRVGHANCSCGAVGRLRTDPLVVARPQEALDLWLLHENPLLRIMSGRLRGLLEEAAPDLRFAPVWFEDERPAPAVAGE